MIEVETFWCSAGGRYYFKAKQSKAKKGISVKNCQVTAEFIASL